MVLTATHYNTFQHTRNAVAATKLRTLDFDDLAQYDIYGVATISRLLKIIGLFHRI